MSCCLPQIQLLLAILANSSVYDLQRTGDIIPTPVSFVLSVHLFVDGKISTTSFQYPIFYSTP